jgi:hypothetical protein
LWNLLDMSDGPSLELASVNACIAMADLFKGMESDTPGPP